MASALTTVTVAPATYTTTSFTATTTWPLGISTYSGTVDVTVPATTATYSQQFISVITVISGVLTTSILTVSDLVIPPPSFSSSTVPNTTTSSRISTTTPSPPVIPRPGKHLSSGSKAGIAIGVILICLLGSLAIWRILVTQRRKQFQHPEEGGDENEGQPPNPKVDETTTKHSLSTTEGKNQVRKARQVRRVPVPNSTSKSEVDGSGRKNQVVVHEEALPESEEISASRQESENSEYGPLVVQSSVSTGDKHERKVDGSKVEKKEEGRLKSLEDALKKVRDEKERLERIQALKVLEEQTKREILNAQTGKS